MDVRAAVPGDEASLQANCFSAMAVADVRRVVIDRFVGDPDGVSLVAVESGEAVGSLTATRRAHPLCRHRVELGGFVVTPAWQGRGVARRLLAAAAAWAGERSCTLLEISCRGGTHAEDAYRGLGFAEGGRVPGGYREADGTEYDEVTLYRAVTA